MKARNHTPEQIVRKLREADRMLGEGSIGGCQGFWTNSGLIFSGFRPPSGWPEILGVSHWV